MSTRHVTRLLIACALAVLGAPAMAHAQSNEPSIAGYATFGRMNFGAAKSFDAVLGDSSFPIIGGGARISSGHLFFDFGAWWLQETGERVFIADDQIYPLGIPLKVTAVPVEITAGWMFHLKSVPRLKPYLAGGLTSMRYREESDFSTRFENDDKTFNGVLARGGIEFSIIKWVGVATEAVWSSIPDAIGEGGVSQSYKETDLGGTSFRVKVTIGR